MTIPNHDARLLPPEDRDAPCRNCSHVGEDHEQDGTCLVSISYRTSASVLHVTCDCDGFDAYTLDDHLADEADRAYSEMKESF